MTTLADISAAMSEMEKRTQPLFAARALPPSSTSAAAAAVAKPSSSSSSVPHSFSAAASRKTLGNANSNVEQQSIQRRRTSVRSQGGNRANYRLMSNVMTGHPMSSAHANVSSCGDADSYENDELQKLEVVLDFDAKMDFITTNRVVAVLEKAIEQLQLLSALDPTMMAEVSPNVTLSAKSTSEGKMSTETNNTNMDSIIKMVTGQRASTLAISNNDNATTVTSNSNTTPNKSSGETVESNIMDTQNTTSNSRVTSVVEMDKLLRKRPKPRGAALFHTPHGQSLRPTVTAVTAALAKSTNISTRGRPSVEELLRRQHELESEYGALLEKIQEIDQINSDSSDNNIITKKSYTMNDGDEGNKDTMEQYKQIEVKGDDKEHESVAKSNNNAIDSQSKTTTISTHAEEKDKLYLQSKLNEVAAELRQHNKMLCVQLKDNPNDVDNWMKIRNEREELIALLHGAIVELTRGYDASLQKPAKEIMGFKRRHNETTETHASRTPSESPELTGGHSSKRPSLIVDNSNSNNSPLPSPSEDALVPNSQCSNTPNVKSPFLQNQLAQSPESDALGNIHTSSILAGNPAVALRRPVPSELETGELANKASTTSNVAKTHPNFVTSTSTNTKAPPSPSGTGTAATQQLATSLSTNKNNKGTTSLMEHTSSTVPMNTTTSISENVSAWDNSSQAPALKQFGSAIQMKRLTKSAALRPRIPLSSSYEEFAHQILQEEAAQEWADALVRKEKELNQNVKQLQSDLIRERALREQEVAQRHARINELHLQIRALRDEVKERKAATNASNAASLEGLQRKAHEEDRLVIEQSEKQQRLLQCEERTHALFAQHLREKTKAMDALAVEWENKNQHEIKHVEVQKIDAEQLRNQCHDKLTECERLALVERELQQQRNTERQIAQERNEAIAADREEAYRAATILQSAIRAMFTRQSLVKSKKGKKSKKAAKV